MTPRTSESRRPHRRAGFTLVELLVSLGLVSLLLLMFAQVFQIATDTMGTQRGLMENDQRARALTTILTNDLNNRTMKNVVPFLPAEAFGTPNYGLDAAVYGFNLRQGFLSISENDLTNDSDDVLHFTALISSQLSGDATASDSETFHGRARVLPVVIPTPNPDTRLYQFRNQPELDDAITYANQAASSTKAEIVYFVRNGNLYRRVLLIRTPLDPNTMDAQPNSQDYTDASQPVNDFFDPANGYYPDTHPDSGDFWRDYDYSARMSYKSTSPWPTEDPTGARFLGGGLAGVNPLSNAAGGSGYFPIGMPTNRFGHDPGERRGIKLNINPGLDGVPLTADDSIGNPREFVGPLFIGRFTHEETSHSNFNFPHGNSRFDIDPLPPTFAVNVGQRINDGNPMKFTPDVDVTDVSTLIPIQNPLTDSNNNGVVDQYEAGETDTRRGEDLLLSNVHGFDVKVWDEIVGDYVDVGHALSGAVATATGTITMPGDFHQGRNRRPSYGPQTGSDNRMFDTWNPAFDANADAVTDANDSPPFVAKFGYPLASPNGHRWTARNYAFGEIVVPTAPVSEFVVYRVIGPAGGGNSPTEPDWTQAPLVGQRMYQDPADTTSLQFVAIPNIKRVRSLKITVRYLDVSSDQMRQVSLIQSLMN